MNDQEIKDILETTKVIASVGLSNTEGRASGGVTRFLKQHGYRIIPVNPHETEVQGEKTYPDLKSVPDKIDLVQIFRNPDAVQEIVEDAIAIGAKTVWMQDGSGSLEAAKKAEDAGLNVIVNDCMLREHARLMS